MNLPFISRSSAPSPVDINVAALRRELRQARAEAATERRRRQRAEAHAVALAERLDEVTHANQSYDQPIRADKEGLS